MTTIQIVLISVCAVVGALSILWGVFRKFTRMSWGGWQVLILFALTFLLKFIPMVKNATLTFCLIAGGFFGVTALILGAGALVRRLLVNHRLPVGIRVLDRILGGLTALIDWVVIVAAVGGFALVCCDAFGVGAVGFITSSGIWTSLLSAHAADVILVGFLVYSVKAGYKLGMVKSLFALLGLTLTLVSFVGAVLLTIKWNLLHSFAGTVAGWFPLNSVTAGLLGYFIVVFIVFLAFFAVSMILCSLLHILIKRTNRRPVFTVIDGIILSVVFYLLAAAFVCAVHYGVNALITIDLSGNETLAGIADAMRGVAQKIGCVLISSPLSQIFYFLNPIYMLV